MQSRIAASTLLCRARIPSWSKPSWSSMSPLAGLSLVLSPPPQAVTTSAAPSRATAMSSRIGRMTTCSPRVRMVCSGAGAQRLDGLERCRAQGGVGPGEQADERAEDRRAEGDPRVEDRRPGVGRRDGDDDDRAQTGPGDAAGQAHGRALEQELRGDVPARGTQGAAQADLADALENRDQRDVGDADGPDEQRDAAEQQEQGVEVLLDLA